MNAYYIRSPRNFRNEYTVYVVEKGSPSEEKLKDLYGSGLQKITRKTAIQRGIRQPRWAARVDGAPQWYGGFPMGLNSDRMVGRGHLTDSEIIEAAKKDTEDALELQEEHRRMRRQGTP